MRYDHYQVKQGKITVAKREMIEAARKAVQAGLTYEEVCECIAEALNKETQELLKKEGQEAS